MSVIRWPNWGWQRGRSHSQSPWRLAVVNRELEMMSPTLLRKVWTTIDSSATTALIRLSDGEMAQALVDHMSGTYGLSSEESSQIRAYVSRKASLIRDVALR